MEDVPMLEGCWRFVADADHYYSASDHSDEELEEWSRGLEVPALDDHSAPTNTTKMLFRCAQGVM